MELDAMIWGHYYHHLANSKIHVANHPVKIKLPPYLFFKRILINVSDELYQVKASDWLILLPHFIPNLSVAFDVADHSALKY